VSAFRQVVGADEPAPRAVAFPPSIFDITWASRPRTPTTIGLRVPSDHAVSCARANAANFAVELHPSEDAEGIRVATYEDAFLRELCAAAMCRPENVREPWFGTPEDDVRTKLTSDGAKAIWHEVERLNAETSPTQHGATDDEMRRLAAVLAEPELIEALPAERAKRVRRFAAFIVDELEGAG
jgi:hypothetical protein